LFHEPGILSTLYILGGLTAAECLDCVQREYAHEPFIRVRKSDDLPSVRGVAYTNFCDMTFTGGLSGQPVIGVCALDNLLKGASGLAYRT